MPIPDSKTWTDLWNTGNCIRLMQGLIYIEYVHDNANMMLLTY